MILLSGAFRLFSHGLFDQGDFWMEFLAPFLYPIDKGKEDRVLRKSPAGLRTVRRQRLPGKPGEVYLQHFTSLRFCETLGVFQFHQLGINRCRGISTGIPLCYSFLDLGINRVQGLHGEC